MSDNDMFNLLNHTNRALDAYPTVCHWTFAQQMVSGIIGLFREEIYELTLYDVNNNI